MNVTEVFPHGIELRTFDGDLPNVYTIKYQVLVNGRIAWQRHAVAGTHWRHRNALATAQRQEAIHLVILAERELNESLTH